jgi:ABC-2 type transport system permease protein
VSDLVSTLPGALAPRGPRPARPRWAQLVWYLTLRELRSRYKRTALGWTWSLLNPLLTALILSAVFGTIFRVQAPVGDPSGLDGFTFYLLAGLLVWNMFAACLNNSMAIIVNNAGLIQKVNFPRSTLVWSTCASAAVTLVIEMAVLAGLIVGLGGQGIPLTIWMVPIITVILGVFSAGVGMVLATANVYFRDVAYLIGVVLTAWFYLTPIVYTMQLVPENWTVLGRELPARTIIEYNPMTRYVDAMRNVMYDFRVPALSTWLWIVGMAAVTLVVGWSIFQRFEARFAEEL